MREEERQSAKTCCCNVNKWSAAITKREIDRHLLRTCLAARGAFRRWADERDEAWAPERGDTEDLTGQSVDAVNGVCTRWLVCVC